MNTRTTGCGRSTRGTPPTPGHRSQSSVHGRPSRKSPCEAGVRAAGGGIVKPSRLLALGGAAAGAGILSYGTYSAITWARYGHVRPDRHPHDELLQRFIPAPEIDEYHHINVCAPVAITFAAAKDMDLQTSPIAKIIFRLREMPARLSGEPFPPTEPSGIVDQTLALGWGVLAEVPDREIVVGAYTQPWHQQVTSTRCRRRSSRRSTNRDTRRSCGRLGRSRSARTTPSSSPAPGWPRRTPSPGGGSACIGRRCRPASSSFDTRAFLW